MAEEEVTCPEPVGTESALPQPPIRTGPAGSLAHSRCKTVHRIGGPRRFHAQIVSANQNLLFVLPGNQHANAQAHLVGAKPESLEGRERGPFV
jgi:hypothetical protein